MGMSTQLMDGGFMTLISLQQAFLASLPALQGNGVELAMRDSYGLNFGDYLARYDHDSHSWRMFQQSFQWMADESLDGSSVTWPRSGLMLRGIAYPLPPLARPIEEIESGLLPTPHANCHTGPGTSGRDGGLNLQTAVARWPTPTLTGNYNRKGSSPNSGDGLATAVKKWPTPTARDHKDTGDCANVPINGLLGRAVNPSKASGSLNPTWTEWLQGYPAEWTVCEDSATPSSRKSPSSSSKQSHEKSKFADNPADKT